MEEVRANRITPSTNQETSEDDPLVWGGANPSIFPGIYPSTLL